MEEDRGFEYEEEQHPGATFLDTLIVLFGLFGTMFVIASFLS